MLCVPTKRHLKNCKVVQMAEKHLLQAASYMPDDSRSIKLLKVPSDCISKLMYHSTTCASTFKKAARRYKDKMDKQNARPEAVEVIISTASISAAVISAMRRKQCSCKEFCIICNSAVVKHKQKKDHKLYIIREAPCAQKLLNAAQLFQDDVFNRMALMNDIHDVFGADVSRHNICLTRYFNAYNKKIDVILENYRNENNALTNSENVNLVFDNILQGITFGTTGYSLSYLRDEINKSLTADESLSNCVVKDLLIQKFGEKICFSYPSNKRISQLVFSSSIQSETLVDNLRQSCIKQCADKLRNKMKQMSFALKGSFCKAEDLSKSQAMFEENRPKLSMEFMKSFLIDRLVSEKNPKLLLRVDTVYQNLFYILHDGKEPNPMHVALGQAVHTLTRSKTLIEILNHRSLCIGYSEVKIDTSLAQMCVDLAGDNRVPVAPVFSPDYPTQGAMYNYKFLEKTLSSKGSSHDTVMVLFQNTLHRLLHPISDSGISQRHNHERDTKFRRILPCQELVLMPYKSSRGQIPSDFVTS